MIILEKVEKVRVDLMKEYASLSIEGRRLLIYNVMKTTRWTAPNYVRGIIRGVSFIETSTAHYINAEIKELKKQHKRKK